MKRLIFSIIVALLANIIVSTLIDVALHAAGIFPAYGEPTYDTSLLLLAFTYRALLSIAAAFLAAAIAKEKAKKAVLILGIIGSLLWLAGAIMLWDYASPWYNLIGVIAGVPLALAGGRLYQNRHQKLVTA